MSVQFKLGDQVEILNPNGGKPWWVGCIVTILHFQFGEARLEQGILTTWPVNPLTGEGSNEFIAGGRATFSPQHIRIVAVAPVTPLRTYKTKRSIIQVLASLLLFSLHSPAQSSIPPRGNSLDALFTQAASESALPVRLLRAVCWVESNHIEDQPLKADGLTPSLGVCQVKLKAARDTGYKGGMHELRRSEVNVFVAARYLRLKLDRYKDWRKAVTAYHLGHYSSRVGVLNLYVISVSFAMKEGR